MNSLFGSWFGRAKWFSGFMRTRAAARATFRSLMMRWHFQNSAFNQSRTSSPEKYKQKNQIRFFFPNCKLMRQIWWANIFLKHGMIYKSPKYFDEKKIIFFKAGLIFYFYIFWKSLPTPRRHRVGDLLRIQMLGRWILTRDSWENLWVVISQLLNTTQ